MTIENTLERIAVALETIAASYTSPASEPTISREPAPVLAPVSAPTPTTTPIPQPVATAAPIPVVATTPEIKPPFTTAAEAKQYVIDAYMPVAADAAKVEGMRQILEQLKLEGDALDRITVNQFQGLFNAIEAWRKV